MVEWQTRSPNKSRVKHIVHVAVSSVLQKMNPSFNVKHIRMAQSTTLSTAQNVTISFALEDQFSFRDEQAGQPNCYNSVNFSKKC
jgi:putative flippase GtrA